jgi:hypothetical protein
MALTDIPGIGSKTADKLRSEGITSKKDLFQAFKRNDSTVVGGPFDDGLNSRALQGIRQALTERGDEFVDPVYGVPVTSENEQARETFDLELGRDVASGFGQFTRDEPSVDASMNLLDAAGDAIQGDLGQKFDPPTYDELKPEKYSGDWSDERKGLEEADEGARARKEAFEFGLDAATNLSPYDRDTLEAGNQLAQQTAGMGAFTVTQTETVKRELNDETIQAEENIGVQSRDYARARKHHQERSARARDVDNQRKAEVTGEYEEWREDPSRHDFPGIDTPGGRQDIITEDQREQAQQIDEVVQGADNSVTEVAFGEPLSKRY